MATGGHGSSCAGVGAAAGAPTVTHAGTTAGAGAVAAARSTADAGAVAAARSTADAGAFGTGGAWVTLSEGTGEFLSRLRRAPGRRAAIKNRVWRNADRSP